MASSGFTHTITTTAELDELYRAPSRLVANKKTDRISAETAAFIGRSRFVLLATADAEGRVTVSPKGGPAGFVAVLDEHRLAIPDASGNNLIDGLRNLVVNPTIGLLFVVPSTGETLRINGRAVITTDPELIERVTLDGERTPKAVIGVEVDRAFIHCSQAFLRGGMWDPTSWAGVDHDEVIGMLHSHLADNAAADTLAGAE
jgi:PPOX class probable FMN-dependent enzyme